MGRGLARRITCQSPFVSPNTIHTLLVIPGSAARPRNDSVGFRSVEVHRTGSQCDVRGARAANRARSAPAVTARSPPAPRRPGGAPRPRPCGGPLPPPAPRLPREPLRPPGCSGRLGRPGRFRRARSLRGPGRFFRPLPGLSGFLGRPRRFRRARGLRGPHRLLRPLPGLPGLLDRPGAVHLQAAAAAGEFVAVGLDGLDLVQFALKHDRCQQVAERDDVELALRPGEGADEGEAEGRRRRRPGPGRRGGGERTAGVEAPGLRIDLHQAGPGGGTEIEGEAPGP